MYANWLYVSESAIRPDDVSEVEAIVRVSIKRNSQMQLTGVLLFSGARFAQYLEGPQAQLQDMINSITADERHNHVITILRSGTEVRRYGDWQLAYSGRSSYVDRSILQALMDTDSRDLLQVMDAFVAGLH
jgi:hypothetical protein